MILHLLNFIAQEKTFEAASRRYAQRGRKPLIVHLKRRRAWVHDGLNGQTLDVNDILNPIVYHNDDNASARTSIDTGSCAFG